MAFKKVCMVLALLQTSTAATYYTAAELLLDTSYKAEPRFLAASYPGSVPWPAVGEPARPRASSANSGSDTSQTKGDDVESRISENRRRAERKEAMTNFKTKLMKRTLKQAQPARTKAARTETEDIEMGDNMEVDFLEDDIEMGDNMEVDFLEDDIEMGDDMDIDYTGDDAVDEYLASRVAKMTI